MRVKLMKLAGVLGAVLTLFHQKVSMALLMAFLLLVHRTTGAQVVTTPAGSGAPGSVDGKGAEASFSYPLRLSIGPAGNVYVADTNRLTFREITSYGLVTTLAGDGHPGYDQGVGTQARFFGPLGVAADVSGNPWVADADDGYSERAVRNESVRLKTLMVFVIGKGPETALQAPASPPRQPRRGPTRPCHRAEGGFMKVLLAQSHSDKRFASSPQLSIQVTATTGSRYGIWELR